MTRKRVQARSAEDALAQANRLIESLRAQLAQAEEGFAKANEAVELLLVRLVDPLLARVAELEARRPVLCDCVLSHLHIVKDCPVCHGTGAVLVSP